jgi:uncharacterized membrane protein
MNSRLENFWARFDRKLDRAVRRYEALLVIAALAVITAFSLLYAHFKLFWLDEFLTYNTAMLGSPAAVWKCLRTLPMSVDPPVYHVLLQYWLRALFPTEFTARLPSVIAYTLMCLCLYCFVRKYMDVYAGFLVLALALGCEAFDYAHEARPYALVLAAVSLTLLSWTVIADRRRGRALALFGMWVGIATAVGSHWFGCLAVVPFILGEMVRSWQERKIDAGVWLVSASASATVLLYLPLLKGASAYRSMPWKGVHPWDAFEALAFVLTPCVIPLAVILVVCFVLRWVTKASDLRIPQVSAPVLTCIVTLALISFPAFVFAELVTHVLLPRYVLFCTIGLLPLLGETVDSLAGKSPACRVAACLVVASCVLLFRARDLKYEAGNANSEFSAIADLGAFSQQPSLPIVLGDEETFLRIEAHGSLPLRQRVVWVTDPSVPRMQGQNTFYLSIESLRLWTHDPIRDLSQFLNANDEFYYVEYKYDPNSWLLRRMMEAHAEISFQGTFAKGPVYFISVRH